MKAPALLVSTALTAAVAGFGARAQTPATPAPAPAVAPATAPIKVDYEITVPKGYKVVKMEIGVGSQNSACPSGKPIGPEAELLNPKTSVREGFHFKRPDSKGPEWLFSNGDYFQGSVFKIGKPSHEKAIPTLEVNVDVNEAQGDMAKVTKIFRLETDGDSTGPCDPKKNYRALYVFAAPDFS